MGTKVCTRCKVERDEERFSLHRKKLRGICKQCVAEHKRNRLKLMKVAIPVQKGEETKINNASNLWFGPVIRALMICKI